ncbi:MAG: hypothetical protein WKG32_18590 [Gemmatimonadaceae bacterium]
MRDDDYLWNPRAKADPEIAHLEQVLRPLRYEPAPFRRNPVVLRHARPWRLAAAAGLLITAMGAYAAARALATPWAVTTLDGAAGGARPSARGAEDGRLSPGEWLETGSGAGARITVGRIGRADLSPNSRVRLVRAEGTEHRLALARGTMHARIWAPPRFFLVETPSALAIDLGCVYTLTVDERGAGVLHVESGEVELVEGTRRALVLAGNAATLRPGEGPGLPYPDSSPANFRAALAVYEAAPGPAALDTLLALSGRGTTITLWHLLQRVGGDEREQVYARLAEVAPPPTPVARGELLRLDPRALERWKATLQREWTTESVPVWKRAWRRLWVAAMRVG